MELSDVQGSVAGVANPKPLDAKYICVLFFPKKSLLFKGKYKLLGTHIHETHLSQSRDTAYRF